MENYNKLIKNIIRDIENLASIISSDENVEEYVSETYANFNGEISEALNDCDYRYAALLAVQEELFNRI